MQVRRTVRYRTEHWDACLIPPESTRPLSSGSSQSVGWRDDKHLNEGMLQLVDRVAAA
jgi:hypothetical protein